MKVYVFIGPLEEFEKFIPKEYTNSLTRVVPIMDLAFQANNFTGLDAFESLIVYSNEYTGVKEHFIEGFIHYITLYSGHLFFETVYLHNPPKKILDQLENYKDITLEVENHQYNRVTKENLKQVKAEFDASVFGQKHAKDEILQTIYPLTNSKNNKPKVLMLYGPPGVGKTESAKLINRILDGGRLFRKQLSMFHNDNIYSYIFGDRVYSLAKDLIDRGSNVILLDEFDKAHPLFYSAFYEMFDEGRFEDKYYKVNLDNTIIICTSNYHSEKDIKDRLGAALFSRFDNVVEYKELSREAKLKILEQTYKEELMNFDEDDRSSIEEDKIVEKMGKFINRFDNARDIQKNLVKVMSYPLLEKL